MKNVMLLIAMMVSVGCATTQISPEAKTVRFLAKSDAPSRCQEVESFFVSAMFQLNQENVLRNKLRAKAYTTGGNLVTLDRKEGEPTHTYHGTSYKCPN
jgi:hypothetical protein